MSEHATVDTDEIAAFMEENAPKPEAQNPPAWVPDYPKLNKAAGDPSIWAHELTELIGHTTGQWIAEETIESWLTAFSDQVRARANRKAVTQVSNYPIDAEILGDPLLLLLQLRGQIADTFKPAAGL